MSRPSAPFRNPLIVGLDVDTREEALRLADDLADVVGGFKIGPRLCLREGASLTKELATRAPVFMDNKHFDIPSTMEAAVRASFEAGASVVTVHALSGAEALSKMAALEQELTKIRPFKILAVTILTSWDELSVPSVMKSQKVSEHVEQLATLVATSGLQSLVCSPHELTMLAGRGLYLVTPGIRFESDAKGDQKRIAGPAQALADGASALVVARPIVQAANPREAAVRFVAACLG